MKKQLLLILVVFLFLHANCQVQGILAVSTSKINVVYAGMNNPITIAVEGEKPEKIFVTASDGILTGDKGKYSLKVPHAREHYLKEIELIIFKKKFLGKSKELERRVFQVKNFPKPVAAISIVNSKNQMDFDGGSIHTRFVKMLDEVTLKLTDFNFYDIHYTVVKYRFIFIPKDSTQAKSVFEVKGAKLTPAIKELLTNTNLGDRIIIYDLYCNQPGSYDIRLPGAIVLTISDL